MWYAIVFRRDFQPGEHWTDHLPEAQPGEAWTHGTHRARRDDSDRKQRWSAGDLYSTGDVLGELPAHLEAISIGDAPPAPGAVWDRDARAFVTPEPAD